MKATLGAAPGPCVSALRVGRCLSHFCLEGQFECEDRTLPFSPLRRARAGGQFPSTLSFPRAFVHAHRSVSAQISNHDSLRISLTVFICQNSFLDSYSQNSASPRTQEAVGTDGRHSVSAAVGPLGNYQQVISAASVIRFCCSLLSDIRPRTRRVLFCSILCGLLSPGRMSSGQGGGGRYL